MHTDPSAVRRADLRETIVQLAIGIAVMFAFAAMIYGMSFQAHGWPKSL